MVARRIVSRQAGPDIAPPASGLDLPPSVGDDGSHGAPGGIGTPLDAASLLGGWRHPQYLESSPHRLPGVVRKSTQPLIFASGAPSAIAPLTTPTVGVPIDQDGMFDPHHYARMNSGNIGLLVVAPSAPFLTAPATYRNALVLRNGHATANMYIDFGQPASLLSPLKIAPGQTLLFDVVVPQDDLYAFADVAGATLVYAFSNIPGPLTSTT